MKIPIPEDWNGTSWSRFSICWPDSPAWIALLLGFITTPKRGRFWDERSGIVTQAQQIGKQIFDFNYPLDGVIVSCADADLLIKSNLLLVAAITGQPIDLSAIEPENYLDQAFDFSSTGLANRLGPQVAAGSEATIQATLERLKIALDDLAVIVADTPQGKDLEPVLNAIEDILGGDWEPGP